MATHHHVRTRLQGALDWSLASITLAYVLIVPVVGAIALQAERK